VNQAARRLLCEALGIGDPQSLLPVERAAALEVPSTDV